MGVSKPWGSEDWWVLPRVVLKKLFIKANNRFSLQFHNFKEEILYVVEGTGVFVLGEESFDYKPGDCFKIPTKTIHRVEAKEETVIIEASTTELSDVVRGKDDYDRVEQ